jgi:hypothetical protein
MLRYVEGTKGVVVEDDAIDRDDRSEERSFEVEFEEVTSSVLSPNDEG